MGAAHAAKLQPACSLWEARNHSRMGKETACPLKTILWDNIGPVRACKSQRSLANLYPASALRACGFIPELACAFPTFTVAYISHTPTMK